MPKRSVIALIFLVTILMVMLPDSSAAANGNAVSISNRVPKIVFAPAQSHSYWLLNNPCAGNGGITPYWQNYFNGATMAACYWYRDMSVSGITFPLPRVYGMDPKTPIVGVPVVLGIDYAPTTFYAPVNVPRTVEFDEDERFRGFQVTLMVSSYDAFGNPPNSETLTNRSLIAADSGITIGPWNTFYGAGCDATVIERTIPQGWGGYSQPGYCRSQMDVDAHLGTPYVHSDPLHYNLGAAMAEKWWAFSEKSSIIGSGGWWGVPAYRVNIWTTWTWYAQVSYTHRDEWECWDEFVGYDRWGNPIYEEVCDWVTQTSTPVTGPWILMGLYGDNRVNYMTEGPLFINDYIAILFAQSQPLLVTP